jgi:hypothetical protein
VRHHLGPDVNGRDWLETRVEGALRELAETPHPASRERRAPHVLARLEAQAAALVATGALTPDQDPTPALRRLLAARGLAEDRGHGPFEARPQWEAILDAPPPDPPRLLGVLPVVWHAPVLPRGALWVSALEAWSDRAVVSLSAVGAHGLWRLVHRLDVWLTDDAATTYERRGVETGTVDATRLAMRAEFAPAIAPHATEVVLAVRCRARSARRVVTLGAAGER